MQRDQELLKQLAVCRWLTTSQIKALCFPDVSVEMARRRLRLLAEHSFVRTWRTIWFSEALHVLGQEGRRLLLSQGWPREPRLERRMPRHFEHSLVINDLRVWLEQRTRLDGCKVEFFYAYWELPELDWSASIIPDAICSLRVGDCPLTLAFEYDRGEESLVYIVRTKLTAYAKGLDGFPISKVVFITEAEARAVNLCAHATGRVEIKKFLFTTREQLLRSWSVTGLFS